MSRTSLGLITSGVLNGGAKKALHWITGGLIRIGVVKVVDGGLVIVGRPVNHRDLVGEVAYVNLVGSPVAVAPISGAMMLTELSGSASDVVLVGNGDSLPVYTITGRPVEQIVISAEFTNEELIGSPVADVAITGEQNDVELE